MTSAQASVPQGRDQIWPTILVLFFLEAKCFSPLVSIKKDVEMLGNRLPEPLGGVQVSDSIYVENGLSAYVDLILKP